MEDKISLFRQHVREIANNPEFVHHKWFVTWHLEIFEKIAHELCEHYPEADFQLVQVLVWLHDYAKILSWENQHNRDLLNKGRDKLIELGFSKDFAHKAADYIEMHDSYKEIDLRKAPIEVQISSSADGCSHLVGPFLPIFWHEGTDKTFVNKTLEELMELNRKKVDKDWKYKIVLPEARQAFEARYKFQLEQAGELPDSFISMQP